MAVLHPDGYDLLKKTIEFSFSSLPIGTKLERMLEAARENFQSDRSLHLKPAAIPKGGFLSRVLERGEPLWVDEAFPFREEEALEEERDLLCPAFACLPLFEGPTSDGIFYLGFKKNRRFSPGEVDLLLLFAKEMEMTLRNDRLQQAAAETTSEWNALHQMGKATSSLLDLGELLDLVVNTGLKIVKARGAVLRVERGRHGMLAVRSSIGEYHQNPLDERIARRVFFSKNPLSLSRSGKEKPFLSLLCVPLISKDKGIGTLTFYDKESNPSRFDERDLKWLATLANQMSNAIENAMTQGQIGSMAEDHERRVRQLSTLWELNKALLTTVHFERIVHMTLTAITIGDGLGFNRAMLFLVDEKTHVLQGTMAVGPDNAEEAGKIWSSLSQKRGSPSELAVQILSSTDNHSLLNRIVKEIQIPLGHDQCILSRTVLAGKPFNIRVPHDQEAWLQTRCERGCHIGSEVGCYVSEHLSRDPNVYAFATVPLWGKGKVIGVILVDNLYNQKPITDEDIHYLTMFSGQAGLAIENALLYRNLNEVHQQLKEAQTFLVHQEKMAALGELSTSVAHEIRNPLVSIGGFARRLDRSLPDDAAGKRYTRTIVKEVERVEKILSQILAYTHEGKTPRKELDLREVMEESLAMVSDGLSNGEIELAKGFSEDIPGVKGDPYQLKQVFFNLVSNACEAMNGKGKLSIRIHPLFKNGFPFVRVDVEDTGAGIDPENLHHIFNPFYTTKDNRLGLGLPIIHKIVTSHQGQIEVNNHPGKGVTFSLTFPAQEEKQR